MDNITVNLLTFTGLGAADATYSIQRSRLPGPHADCVLEKVSVAGGKFITGGFTIGLGYKDSPVHVARDGYVPKLSWISKRFVVLWDEGDKRGWLVNGASALLHLVRASLEHNKVDKVKSAFLFKSEKMEEASLPYTADSAMEVLLNGKNMKLQIYPGKGEMYEETTRKGSTSEEVSKKKMTYYRFEDRVEQFYNILEKMIDHQIDIAGQSGVKLKLRARKHFEGWDFRDLATDQDPFYPRVATLQTIGKGWVDFTRAIHAITLFGRGFGEIIKPVASNPLCGHWDKVPAGKYYLAACVSDVKNIMETLDGDHTSSPMMLCRSMIWHNPERIFRGCQCMSRETAKHSDLAQVILPLKLRKILPKGSPVPLEDHGAVVFGHNWNFNWYWRDTGDPIEGTPPLPSDEVEEAPFYDSGIGSSGGSLVPDSSGDTAESGTQRAKAPEELILSKEATSSKPTKSPKESSRHPLSDPTASVSTETDDGVLPTTSIQRQDKIHLGAARQRHTGKRGKQLLRHLFEKARGLGSNTGDQSQD